MAKVDLSAEVSSVEAVKADQPKPDPKPKRAAKKAPPKPAAAEANGVKPRRRRNDGPSYEERTVRKWLRIDRELLEAATAKAEADGYLGLSSAVSELLEQWLSDDD